MEVGVVSATLNDVCLAAAELEFLPERRPEVIENRLTEFLERAEAPLRAALPLCGIVLDNAVAGRSNPLLQYFEFFALGRIRADIVAAALGRNRRNGVGVAEEEARARLGRRISEGAVDNLKFGNAAVRKIDKPAFLEHRARRLETGTVAFPEQSDEEWPALIDRFETKVERFGVFCLLPGDPPAEIDVFQVDAPRLDKLTQFWKHDTHEMVSLGVHIPEGRGDKDTRRAP